jgi:cholesterol transport system auxiliary component
MRTSKTLILTLISSFLLLGCVGNAPRQSAVATYDLGDLAGDWRSPGFPIAAIEVRASSWLDGIAQRYRLAYDDPQRRHVYAESRWAASPAELLQRHLVRRVVHGQPDFDGSGCRLNLLLDEFEQRFERANASQAVIAVSASLLPRGGDTLLSKRAFVVRAPAPTADAHGGVVAARQAVDALATDLSNWLTELARERPQVMSACKGN